MEQHDGRGAIDGDASCNHSAPAIHSDKWARVISKSVVPSITFPREVAKMVVPSIPLNQEIVTANLSIYSKLAADLAKPMNDIIASVTTSFDGIQKTAKALSGYIDYSGLRKSLTGVIEQISKLSYITLLEATDWPLYLVEDDVLVSSVSGIDRTLPIEELRERIADIAFEQFGEEWLAHIDKSWQLHDELSDGVREKLRSAALRFSTSDYEGCTAILMCLFEGLIAGYYGNQIRKLKGEKADEFDSYAVRYSIGLSTKKDGFPRELKSAKDQVVILLMGSGSGEHIWNAAVSYIIKTVLTNSDDEKLAEHNPLRNKVCHGTQTCYGTREHALKAILATDIVVRLGCLYLEGEGI